MYSLLESKKYENLSSTFSLPLFTKKINSFFICGTPSHTLRTFEKVRQNFPYSPTPSAGKELFSPHHYVAFEKNKASRLISTRSSSVLLWRGFAPHPTSFCKSLTKTFVIYYLSVVSSSVAAGSAASAASGSLFTVIFGCESFDFDKCISS